MRRNSVSSSTAVKLVDLEMAVEDTKKNVDPPIVFAGWLMRIKRRAFLYWIGGFLLLMVFVILAASVYACRQFHKFKTEFVRIGPTVTIESIPVFRRDNKDVILMQAVIQAELERLNRIESGASKSNFDEYMVGFKSGLWSAFRSLNELLTEENVAHNQRVSADPDHWFEVNIANAVLFDNLKLGGIKELLPGRLFTTRMPRNVTHNQNVMENFKAKAKANDLRTVLILTEAKEQWKYFGADLEEFYQSLGLEVLHRPIVDFSLPTLEAIVQNVKDLTTRLASGRNCLVHCAGGSGRTGLVIASLMKNLGVQDPIAWLRRVKTTYVETEDQARFVRALPVVMDAELADAHPDLVLAITAEHLVDTRVRSVARTAPNPYSEAQVEGFRRVFALVDGDGSGSLSPAEIRSLLDRMGAEITEEQWTEFAGSGGGLGAAMGVDVFVDAMTATRASHPAHGQPGSKAASSAWT